MRHFTPLSFAGFLGTLKYRIEHENHHVLEQCGRLVQREAKRVIGTYEYGWPPLAPSTIKRKGKDTPLLETGKMRESIKYTVTHDRVQIGTDDPKAKWHELGTSKMPPRPFLTGALKAKTPEVVRIIGRHTQKMLSGEG